jgi:hypothetical protein
MDLSRRFCADFDNSNRRKFKLQFEIVLKIQANRRTAFPLATYIFLSIKIPPEFMRSCIDKIKWTDGQQWCIEMWVY